jgi:hypothetical protein
MVLISWQDMMYGSEVRRRTTDDGYWKSECRTRRRPIGRDYAAAKGVEGGKLGTEYKRHIKGDYSAP